MSGHIFEVPTIIIPLASKVIKSRIKFVNNLNGNWNVTFIYIVYILSEYKIYRCMNVLCNGLINKACINISE